MAQRIKPTTRRTIAAVVVVLTVLAALLGRAALAQEGQPAPAPTPTGSPIHPTFPLLDADGANVLESGAPVSTMTTCGGCHDTAFIAANNFHADVGLSDYAAPGTVPGGRLWDTGTGLFGKWNPILYRYLSPQGDARVDLTTPGWVELFGARHAGGGPAETARDGRPLVELAPDAADVEASLIDPQTGEAAAWDWAGSGAVELNCFLCHMPNANNEARLAALAAGDFASAGTATLVGTGIVEQRGDGYAYVDGAFDDDGLLKQDFVTVQDPTTANCGNCHGVTHVDQATPLTVDQYALGDYVSLTTGQIMSPQRINAGGLNIADKQTLDRSWDIHMERVLACTDCHYSLNNPIYFQGDDAKQPAHLTFDPRRIDLGEYLYRPLHQFAKGQSAQGTLAPGYDNTLRRCESCHSIENTHDWLPYKDRHTAAMSCETCHTPKLYAPALQTVDWTALTADGGPVQTFRGVEGGEMSNQALITGYEPVLLPRDNADGTTTLAPYNLVSTWYWLYGDPPRPVPLRDLQAAYFDGDDYHPDVLAAFDGDGDGRLSRTELLIATEEQEQLIAGRLAALGLDNPRIAGEVQPFGVNHNTAHGDWAVRDCRVCHGEESRLTQPFDLSDRTPGGVQPALDDGGVVAWPGTVEAAEDGSLIFQPDAGEAGLYILGHNAVDIVDWIGILMVLGVVVGVTIHAGMRFFAARRRATEAPVEVRREYMYDVYERFWHWLQTAAILILLFTGLIIHEPDKFGIFSFSYVVQVHNIVALLLVINAALSLFYHLASGEIKQFIPRPRGFFDRAFEQAIYYVRGIFRGEPHPMEKTRERKMNPLQQVTYLVILNVLLPLQILTGALMWGYQRRPDLAAVFGGLPVLAPFHTLIAWAFTAFIILHVYLTTTGPKPLTGIQAMMVGWEDVEVHPEEHPAEPLPGAAD